MIDADFTAEGASDAVGGDAPAGGTAATTSAEEPDRERPVAVEAEASAAGSVGSEGGEEGAGLPLLPQVTGEADGDSGSADDGRAASGENDSGTTMPSWSSTGTYSDPARFFVQEVGDAVDRAAGAMEERGGSGGEDVSTDISHASSLIRIVLSVVERRLGRPQSYGLLVDLGPRLHSLLESGSHPEDRGTGNGETNGGRAKRSQGPSGRQRWQSSSGGRSQAS